MASLCILYAQEDVDQFMQDPGNPSAEVVLRRFDEQYNKYKFMEVNLTQKQKRSGLAVSFRFSHKIIIFSFPAGCVTRFLTSRNHWTQSAF